MTPEVQLIFVNNIPIYLAAIFSGIAMLIGIINRDKITKTENKVETAHKEIEGAHKEVQELKITVDGRMGQLLQQTTKAAEAAGRAAGILAGTAAGEAIGRAEGVARAEGLAAGTLLPTPEEGDTHIQAENMTVTAEQVSVSQTEKPKDT